MLPILLLANFMSTAAPDFPVVMEMEYCYDDSPCAETVWTFTADGRMDDDLGYVGDWTYRSGTLTVLYDHGSRYRGEFNADRCFEGRNERSDGTPGTWTACR